MTRDNKTGNRDTAAIIAGAGITALLADSPRTLVDGLNIEAITKLAHVSEATFFRTFHTKRRFVEAVLDALADPPAPPGNERSDVAALLLTADGDPLHVIRQVATANYLAVRDGDDLRRTILGLGLASSRPSAMDRLRAGYEAADQRGRAAYQTLLERWGASLRKPFTAKHVAVCLTAMVEGMALRWLADPRSVPDWLFAEMALAFMVSAIDADQRHEHLDDVASPLAAGISESLRTAQRRPLPDDPRQAVLEAARREFGRRGYYMTSMETVALSAGVPLDTLKRLFPAKPLLIVGALERRFRTVEQATRDDVHLGMDEREVVGRFLQRLAQMAADKREFVDAMIAAATQDTVEETDSLLEVKQRLDFPSLLEPVVASGQHNGVFTTGHSAYDLAAALTNALFLRTFTRRDQSPTDHARAVSAVMLDGIRTRN